MLREIPSRFFSLERGFIRTFVDLTLRPGELPLQYVRGRRREFVSPLPYFLVAATVQLLALLSLRSTMVEHTVAVLTPQIEKTRDGWDKVLIHLGPEPIVKLSEILIDLTRAFYSYLWIVFCIGFAIAFRMMPFAGRRKFHLAEWLVFSVYSIGHIVMLTGMINPFGARLFGFGNWTYVVWAVYLIYLGWATIRFVGGRWYTLVCTAVALIFAFLAYTVVFWIGFIAKLIYEVRPDAAV